MNVLPWDNRKFMINYKLLIIASCLVFGFRAEANEQLYVTTTLLKKIAKPVELTFSANVKPKNISELSAGIGSKLIETALEVGDSVVKGDVVARLDCRDAELGLDAAEQALRQATIHLEFTKRQADRIRKLADTNIASEEIRDTRVTDVARAEISEKSAKTAAEEASLNASRCLIVAPFDAIVRDQLKFVGTQVDIGTPIYQIASVDVNVHINIPFDLKIEELTEFTFEYGDRATSVTVAQISRFVNNQTGTRLVRLNPQIALDPGIPGVVKMFSSQLVLPADYLIKRNRELGIMSLINEQAVFIPRPLAVLGQPIDVSDLAPNTEIIIEGRFRANDGDSAVVAQ